MPLSIKNTTEVIISRTSNGYKCLSIERQVRVKEHSRPIVSCSTVHNLGVVNEVLGGLDVCASPYSVQSDVAGWNGETQSNVVTIASLPEPNITILSD